MKRRHDQAPQYQAFVDRYANDPVAFVEEVLQLEVTPVMAMLLEDFFKPGARVLMKSERWNEEIRPLAPYALHRLLFGRDDAGRSETQVACPGSKFKVGNDYRTLALQLLASTPWLAPYLHMNGQSIYLDSKQSWRLIHFRSARAHVPNELCGPFGKGVCWLIEDAHNMPESCFAVIHGSLIEDSASLILSCERAQEVACSTERAPWEVIEIRGPAIPQSPAQSC